MTKIKICGISDAATLAAVCKLPIQFIGFVYHSGSPRHVNVPLLAELVNATPKHINTVLVVVDPTDAFLDEVFEHCAPDYVQLHGDEPAERVEEIKNLYGCKVIKAIAIAEASDVAKAAAYENAADIILFDTKAPKGVSGGTGERFDWALLSDYNAAKPWMLSGGLSAENVAEAVRITNAPMVDASSHLEMPVKSGQKDLEKIKEFVGVAGAIS